LVFIVLRAAAVGSATRKAGMAGRFYLK
jgi:hypothetical protein